MQGKKLTRAMILAAGFGTRLKPLTDITPKPLVEYKGKPMVQILIDRLVSFGITDITLNTHYLREKVKVFFGTGGVGPVINLSHEKEILGTGGGIKNSEMFLRGTGAFIVHNVDVVSEIDFNALFEFHIQNSALATLAVKKRDTARPLLADDNNILSGRVVEGTKQIFREGTHLYTTAFCGVYILDDRVFDLFPPQDNFDIIPFFLDMTAKGEKIICFDIGDTFWKDIGRLSSLES